MNIPDIDPLRNLSTHYKQSASEVTHAFHNDGWNDAVNESYSDFLKQLGEMAAGLDELVSKTSEYIDQIESMNLDEKNQSARDLCTEAEML